MNSADEEFHLLKFEVAFRHFRGSLASWEELFQKAADFASRVGPEKLISISHSEDGNDGVVTVWYWKDV